MPNPNHPPRMRILRQTLVLSQKNLLLFLKAPILTIIRALIIPIGLTLILCYLKLLSDPGTDNSFNGFESSPTAVRDLTDAIRSVDSNKLVFVTNGLADAGATSIINQITSQGFDGSSAEVVDDPDDLFDLCKQSIDGISDCFAAIIFTSVNETDVEYIVAIDEHLTNENGDIRSHQSLLTDRIFPLQWAIESTIGNLSKSSKPSEQLYTGFLGPYAEQINTENSTSVYWQYLVYMFAAPLFSIILVGVVYHLATFVATERQNMISELMAAQGVTIMPRLLSNWGSFLALYLPGAVACSVLLTQLLFLRTSDILLVFLTFLALTSFTVSGHFVASFFGRGQLAGLYTSVLCVALAFITLANSLSSITPQGQIIGLAAVFPPATWVTLIADVARREYNKVPFTLNPIQPDEKFDSYHVYSPYLHPIFFALQIVLYGLGTYFVERRLWSVTRTYNTIDQSSDVALRLTNLSKTYNPKTKWYWPCGSNRGSVKAIQNLDLEVKKGSVTFLLGPNGGGKTTTLKCVAGMISMDHGSRLELNAGGLVFGICPQINVFWDTLTVEEHIRIWRKLKTAAFGTGNPNDDDDVIAECDLIQKSKAEAKTLSGGQMRKLQLAIAFVGGSNIVCIDEASSGLDPLSRRNIWNIIQQGNTRRTTLVTTHFLDEADILADHIAIIHKGKLVCEGPGTTLKTRYADSYLIKEDSDRDTGEVAWRTLNSAEATRKLLELEAMSDEKTFSVVFPTLEQVFLKVTSDTFIHDSAGDGVAGMAEEEENTDIIEQKIYALHHQAPDDINLDVGRSIGILRQIWVLFKKRYILLQQQSNWISYGINILIPVIVAAALTKFLKRMDPLTTCQENAILLRQASQQEALHASSSYPVFGPLTAAQTPYLVAYPPSNVSSGTPSAIIGPFSAWTGAVQQDLYLHELLGYFPEDNMFGYPGTPTEQAINSRSFVNSTSQMVQAITDQGFYSGIALYSQTPDTAIIYHDVYSYDTAIAMTGMNVITNRLANATTTEGVARKVTAKSRVMRHITNDVDIRALPLTILLCLAFITAAAVSVIYPTYERMNHVRALHYCNGVSPFALWFAYLLFDLQFIIIEALIVYGCLFVGVLTDFWYGASYMVGVFILFGIASYLGAYIVSLYVKKAAFAVAAVIHLLLYALYVAGDVMNDSFGALESRADTYNIIQYAVGLICPAANLSRAFFIGLNVYGMLCGKYGDADVSKRFSYDLFGSIYTNLLVQIIFLSAYLMIYEYGSSEWFRRLIWRNHVPTRLHYIVDSGDAGTETQPEPREKNVTASSTQEPEILKVSRVNKFFGRVFAAENVSFSINANETLALLGANGAGKTTVINMIRGELKPDYGDIYLDGVSVLRQPHKTRLQMGVCPQDDAIDNLTVRQTLNFYAAVKGLRDIHKNVDHVLEALNISMYQSMPAKKLSGGTRRKLSVAIALLGNPRVLLLDEPSTGQDAGAKRILWKALRDISSNRAILLTTHSMEEAEALATNVAILHTRMLVSGTLSSLQVSHGGAFSLRAVLTPGFDSRQAESLIREKFENIGLRVMNYMNSNGQISFNLPHDKKMMGHIMKAMEELKGEDILPTPKSGDSSHGNGGSAGAQEFRIRVLQEYTVTGPTLEEVFMNVARESGTAGGV
ncbi:ABC transporter-like protein [Xylogone sp. PMI_703]|nr:ABC transporter-like protein [Xylogone sp. PMI_703]